MKKIAIIGGGASGLVSAVSAGRACTKDDPPQIVVYEAAPKVGRSILASGNGRCNFSHQDIDPLLYHNADFVSSSLDSLREVMAQSIYLTDSIFAQRDPLLRFFASLGLIWRSEPDGRLYPFTNKASSVLDVLRAELNLRAVRVVCESRVSRILCDNKCQKNRFIIHFADGSATSADSVIVACGALALAKILPNEVPLREVFPILGPLATEKSAILGLNNIRVRVSVGLYSQDRAVCKAKERGEVLFRSYGVSGICIFNLSRFAHRGDVLCLDFFPDDSLHGLENKLRARLKLLCPDTHEIRASAYLCGMLLPQVALSVLRRAGIEKDFPISADDLTTLAGVLKCFSLEVIGIGDAGQCQAHRGGVEVCACDPQTMEVYDIPGLYIVGEALDVDAPCGGYNLHWAWASGYLAGAAACRRHLI